MMRQAQITESQRDALNLSQSILATKVFSGFYNRVPCDVGPEVKKIYIECEGYAAINTEAVLENFQHFIQQLPKQLVSKNCRLSTLKLTFQGFKLQGQAAILHDIATRIKTFGVGLQELSVHVEDVWGVTVKHFRDLLQIVKLAISGLRKLTLQCANWSFQPNQPSWEELNQLIRGYLLPATKLRFLRLQISGWYYRAQSVPRLLGDKEKAYSGQLQPRIIQFHSGFLKLLSQIVEKQSSLLELQVDVRNYCNQLQMAELKKKIASYMFSQFEQQEQGPKKPPEDVEQSLRNPSWRGIAQNTEEAKPKKPYCKIVFTV